MPKPLIAMIDMDPTVEQMLMYTMGFFFPYTGAILYIMTSANINTIVQYVRKPAKEHGWSAHRSLGLDHISLFLSHTLSHSAKLNVPNCMA